MPEACLEKAKQGGFRLDYFGCGFTALTFGALECVLDKGQEDNWFNSALITSAFMVCLFALTALIIWELRLARNNQRPILDLRLFENRTFAISFVMMFIVGLALYATSNLLPNLLQNLMGYAAELAGFVMSFGGIATVLTVHYRHPGRQDGQPVLGRIRLCAYRLHDSLPDNMDLQMSFHMHRRSGLSR